MGVMTHSLGGEYMPKLEASHLAATYDRLVTAAIHIVDTDGIRLERLLEMRRREASGRSHDYANFRRAYLKRIALFIERLGAADQRPADVREIHRQYRQEMETDLRELKRELNIAAGDVLFSKEMGVAVLAAAGSAITPIAGLLGVGALVQTGRKYRQARRAALGTHAMSWLYLGWVKQCSRRGGRYRFAGSDRATRALSHIGNAPKLHRLSASIARV
jgi:hypothetical protein